MLTKPLFNIVLLSPEIPQNTGNVIRLCSNVGARLHLVEPLGFRLDNAKLRRAALDYRDMADIICHPSVESLLELLPMDRVYGAVTNGEVRYDSPRYMAGDTILFGTESSGLPQDVVSRLLPGNHIRIPMKPSNRSLNLSNAVAIIAYEIWRQMGFANSSSRPLPSQVHFS